MCSVIHTVASIGTKDGGPSRTTTSLCHHLSEINGIQVTLITQVTPNEDLVLLPLETKVQLKKVCVETTLSRSAGLHFRQMLFKEIECNKPSVIHDHGIWLPTNHFAVSLGKKFRIPTVIQPRGMLEPWSLEHNKLKKRLAGWAYQRRDLESASLFIATSEQEAESIRRVGLNQPIAIIPNGVESLSNKLPLIQQNSDDNLKTALFLSRIHPKKGLLNLIDAWDIANLTGWRLIIAGPDEGGHLAEVMERVRRRGLESNIIYIGEVEGEVKSSQYMGADLFILPSFSENFGVVVVEALSYGVPVIATIGTPWSELPSRGCGWWIKPTVADLAETISYATSISPRALRDMGENGILYAEEFNWNSIAQNTNSVYRWLLDQESRPSFVYID